MISASSDATAKSGELDPKKLREAGLKASDVLLNLDAYYHDFERKLKEAGAVVIAKANLSEFASSSVNSHSLIGGYVHNPYDLSRSPAGSSGGTGVAVTCNFATIGFGTDTGGSIRNPSSWGNLYDIYRRCIPSGGNPRHDRPDGQDGGGHGAGT